MCRLGRPPHRRGTSRASAGRISPGPVQRCPAATCAPQNLPCQALSLQPRHRGRLKRNGFCHKHRTLPVALPSPCPALRRTPGASPLRRPRHARSWRGRPPRPASSPPGPSGMLAGTAPPAPTAAGRRAGKRPPRRRGRAAARRGAAQTRRLGPRASPAAAPRPEVSWGWAIGVRLSHCRCPASKRLPGPHTASPPAAWPCHRLRRRGPRVPASASA
mmetsp:Transcript_44245/g.132081  ORF Transcript_44245/g.132081 Transcript_44245/m.132081 type:complete len:217 (-) Transcript_44245:50-700(-)